MPVSSDPDDPPVTRGHLLGGRVIHCQPAGGFRSGIEPVLLAASVPARPGEAVLEAGTGAGTALLCLAARVAGIEGLGLEQDPRLTRIAAGNAALNGWDGLRFETVLVEASGYESAFHHAFANPPYHAADGTRSPDTMRDRAKRGSAALLAAWAVTMTRALRHRGTLTFILPAWLLPAGLDALTATGCGGLRLLPLWPKAGRDAKLILLQGTKGARTPMRVRPGLVLHTESGGFTPEAEAILRDGAALEI